MHLLAERVGRHRRGAEAADRVYEGVGDPGQVGLVTVAHIGVTAVEAGLDAATRYVAFCLAPQGIRANAISAGPIKTLAASGIGNFGKLLAYNAHHAPLRRNVTIEEVGNAAAFMLSDLASAITGEILYVDGGLNTTALGNPEPLP